MVIIAQRQRCALYTHFTWPFGFLIALECSNCKFIALPYPYRKIWFEKRLTYGHFNTLKKTVANTRQMMLFLRIERTTEMRDEKVCTTQLPPSLFKHYPKLNMIICAKRRKCQRKNIKIQLKLSGLLGIELSKDTRFNSTVSMVQKWRGFA